MTRDLVTRRGDLADEARVATGEVAQDEERRPPIEGGEDRQDPLDVGLHGRGVCGQAEAVEPGAGQYNGREFILLRDEGGSRTTMKFVTRTSDGSLKYATVSSGEYIVFDRATNEWTGAKPLPDLESLDDGRGGTPFLKEAICAAYKSSQVPFFKGDANRCR